ncbi:MAG: hypothetical protein HYZ33_00855 [Ignavibacteriales bacterium]|nr:hypothetical protein [Ignavibacteriales bacterium]
MKHRKLVLHTDIIIEHLISRKTKDSVMRQALQRYFCYTTVFNAIEVFSLVKTKSERTIVEDTMSAIKILGLNAKSAPNYASLVFGNSLVRMNALVAGLCLESKLPILTRKPSEFRKVKGLMVVTPNDIL